MGRHGNMERIWFTTVISILKPWRPLVVTFVLTTLMTLTGFSLCAEVSCPLEWIGRNGYCYKLYTERVPWQSAATECEHFGGFLTSIVSRQENDFLVASFRNKSSLAWIGMDSVGRWLDGSSSQMFYNNFRYETLSTLRCSVIDLEGSGRWTVSDCRNSELNFICKYDISGAATTPEDDVPSNWEDSNKWGSSDPKDYIALYVLAVALLIFMVCLCSEKVRESSLHCMEHYCFVPCCKVCECVCLCSSGTFRFVYDWLTIAGLALQLCYHTCLSRLGLNRSEEEGRRRRRRRRWRGRRSRRRSTPPTDPSNREPLNRAPLEPRPPTDGDVISGHPPWLTSYHPRTEPTAPPLCPTTDNATAPSSYATTDNATAPPSYATTDDTTAPPSYPTTGDTTAPPSHPTTDDATAPPSYPTLDDTTAPPSYSEAMDPTFDISPGS